MCCLKDDALKFATDLPDRVRNDIFAFHAALDKRFGNNLLPEQHRENLLSIRKSYKETLVEYATRVTNLVCKAYPGFEDSSLITSLTIENLLRGLPDQNLAYEVKTKSPSNVDEAIRLLTWHECCKNGTKKRAAADVRQVEIEYETESEYEESTMRQNVRKVGGSGPRYVTEERLEKRLTVFSKEIRDSQNELKTEICKLANSIDKNSGKEKSPRLPVNSTGLRDVTCYTCQKKGHTSKYCTLRKERRTSPNVDNSNTQVKKQVKNTDSNSQGEKKDGNNLNY